MANDYKNAMKNNITSFANIYATPAAKKSMLLMYLISNVSSGTRTITPEIVDSDTNTGTNTAVDAAIQDDNGSYIDDTTDANNATTNDVDMFPTTPVATEDSFIIGGVDKFTTIVCDIGTAGSGTSPSITWQYWNGAWTNLSGVTDNTSSFTSSGVNNVTFTIPSDWIPSTINSQGPFFYVRANLNSGDYSTQIPIGDQFWVIPNVTVKLLKDKTILSTEGLQIIDGDKLILEAGDIVQVYTDGEINVFASIFEDI